MGPFFPWGLIVTFVGNDHLAKFGRSKHTPCMFSIDLSQDLQCQNLKACMRLAVMQHFLFVVWSTCLFIFFCCSTSISTSILLLPLLPLLPLPVRFFTKNSIPYLGGSDSATANPLLSFLSRRQSNVWENVDLWMQIYVYIYITCIMSF